MRVIIIPGLGDRVAICRLFLPVWRLAGFSPLIHRVGWEDIQPLDEKLAQLDAVIAQQNTPVYLVGLSAGGTMAINALARNPRVKAVVTVSTPYVVMKKVGWPKLFVQSLKQAIANSQGLPPRHILSLHGIHDGVIPASASQSPYVMHRRVPAVGHFLSIAVAMVAYPWYVKRFFKKVSL